MAKRVAKTLSLFQLMGMFPDDDTATRFFEDLRWQDKQTCARCGGDGKLSVNNQTENSYWCGDCRKYFSVRTNTVIENSRISIRKWIFALYLLMTARKGISSLQLSKKLDVTQKTVWFMLHRIREACGFDGGNLLNGESAGFEVRIPCRAPSKTM